MDWENILKIRYTTVDPNPYLKTLGWEIDLSLIQTSIFNGTLTYTSLSTGRMIKTYNLSGGGVIQHQGKSDEEVTEAIKPKLKAFARSMEFAEEYVDSHSDIQWNQKNIISIIGKSKNSYYIDTTYLDHTGCYSVTTSENYNICIVMGRSKMLPAGDNLLTLILALHNDVDAKSEIEGLRDYLSRNILNLDCYFCDTPFTYDIKVGHVEDRLAEAEAAGEPITDPKCEECGAYQAVVEIKFEPTIDYNHYSYVNRLGFGTPRVIKHWDDIKYKKVGEKNIFIKEHYYPGGNSRYRAFENEGESYISNEKGVYLEEVKILGKDFRKGAMVEGSPTILFYDKEGRRINDTELIKYALGKERNFNLDDYIKGFESFAGHLKFRILTEFFRLVPVIGTDGIYETVGIPKYIHIHEENGKYTISEVDNPDTYEFYKSQKNLSSIEILSTNMKWTDYLKKSSGNNQDWESALKSFISEGKKLGIPLTVMELLKLAKEATTSQSEDFETLHRPTFSEEEEEEDV